MEYNINLQLKTDSIYLLIDVNGALQGLSRYLISCISQAIKSVYDIIIAAYPEHLVKIQKNDIFLCTISLFVLEL